VVSNKATAFLIRGFPPQGFERREFENGSETGSYDWRLYRISTSGDRKSTATDLTIGLSGFTFPFHPSSQSPHPTPKKRQGLNLDFLFRVHFVLAF